MATACPGEQLTLTCTANHSTILRWSIVLPEQNNTESRFIAFMGNSILASFSIEGTGLIFNFTRTSEAYSLPLRSELLIDGVTVDINGTEIHCSPLNISDPNTTFIVHVLGGR